jgi:excisionase family DNA binding protein
MSTTSTVALPHLTTVKEATDATRLSRSTLYGLMDRGELEYVKLGRRRLIPASALAELIRRGTVGRRA